MKVPISWLKSFVEWKGSATELSLQLTLHGIEVESIESIAGDTVAGDTVAGDTVLTLGLTPNRADGLSMLGIAREVSALQGKEFKPKLVAAPQGKNSLKDFLSVKVLDRKGCPRYMARMICGVRTAPSPDWIQKRLIQVGLRPINNVVDATNWVMWERGQPLHAFDRRFLRGNQIVVQRAGKEISFTTLDGVARKLHPTDLLICDGQGPVAIAGVMGGANSEIKADTQDVVLEAALFDPISVRRTSKRLGLLSESSKRFERGVDPNGVEAALHRLTELIVETAGGVPTKDWIDLYPQKIRPLKIVLEPREVERILGMAIPSKDCQKILTHLGMKVAAQGKKGLKVEVPTFRPDISRPIDLIEECARIYGYEKLEESLPKITVNVPHVPDDWQQRRKLKQRLVALGFLETVQLNFVSAQSLKTFGTPENQIVRLTNPLSQEEECLRSTLIPSLLQALAFNYNRQTRNLKLFEFKTTFKQGPQSVIETPMLAAVVTGASPKHWREGSKPYDFYTLKALLESFPVEFELRAGSGRPFLIPTTAAEIFWQGESVGWIGELHPQSLTAWEISQPVFAMELNWILCAKALSQLRNNYRSPSRYPYSERDVALVVDQSLEAKSIISLIFEEKFPWIDRVALFDVYQGKGIASGKKSLAFSIRYADQGRTLTDEEVAGVHTRLVTRLCQQFSAELRK